MDYAAESRHYRFEPPNQSEPTPAQPGSPQKLQVMAERYRSGQPLHHPNDETLVGLPVRKAMAAFLAAACQKPIAPYRLPLC